MKIKHFLGICIILASQAVIAQKTMIDRVLVIVNEDVITQSEYDYRYQALQDEVVRTGAADLPPDIDKHILETMISEKLQIQEASRRGLEIGDDELQGALQRFAQSQQLDISQLQAQIAGRGQSFRYFSESVRDSLAMSRLTEYYARARVVVPDYEIDGFIEQNDMGDDKTRYEIAHILFKNPEQNRELAEEVASEIRDGMDFKEAAQNYSEATDAQEGGVIGWGTMSQFPDFFGEALKEMQVGKISDVLESENGLHIVKLMDMDGERQEVIQVKVRHILIQADTQVAKAQAAKKLAKVRQRIVAGEMFSDLARIFSEDSVSAANGGDLGWVSPGETVPNFERTFQQLAIGEISQPVETRFGVHIMQVLERRQKNITDQMIRNRADQILRRQRTEREFDQWVRGLRESAYIEYVTNPG